MVVPVRLGLVGAGAWGRNYLRTASSSSDVQVSCVCRASASPVDGFSEIPVTDDMGQMIRACDAVVVASPPASHETAVMRAIAAGKPVLLEKPAALSATAVERMLLASEKARVPILVGHIHLFSPAFVHLRDLVAAWGGPKRVLTTAGNAGPLRDYPSLYDWGPHDVSMCLSLFGRAPDDIEAMRHAHEDGGTVDVLTLGFGESRATLRFGNGMSRRVRRFGITSGSGVAIYDDTSGPSLMISGSPVILSPASPLQSMLDSFVAVVRGAKEDWRWDHWLALEGARVLDVADHVTSTRTDRFLLPSL